jgi:valyl-tRNA synthetase
MSKSLGNSPDLLGLIDQYGADATRLGIMIASPAGNDILFDESALEQGRNFNNKMWNALKLVKLWEERQAISHKPLANSLELTAKNFPVDWFENRLNQVKVEVEGMMEQFRLSEALKTIYSLIWDDFCSWYLEWVKPGYEQPIEADVYKRTVSFFAELMQLLHPFMPFVTEEIYHLLGEQKEDLCIKQFEKTVATDSLILDKGILLKEIITGLRDVRNKQQVKPKETIELFIDTSNEAIYRSIEAILGKQVNAKTISFTNSTVAESFSSVIGKDKFYIKTEQPINTGHQKTDLLKELEHLRGFLISVEKKLGNEKFVQNAKPDVLALEQKKKADAEIKIKVIEESLAAL